MKKKFISLFAALAVLAAAATGYAAVYEWPQAVMIQKTQTIRFAGVTGQAVTFSCESIEERLGLAKDSLQEITVTSLPKEEDGVLVTGSREVEAYDELGREEINKLCFLPSGNSLNCSFDFIPMSDRSLTANVLVTMTDSKNLAPICTDGELETMEGIPVSGRIDAYEPEGETMTVQLVTPPQKGSVAFEGLDLIYTPFQGNTGEDAFTFLVCDTVGNYSAPCTMNISIAGKTSVSFFADMKSNPSHYAALMLRERGVMTGETLGETNLFYPQNQVGRGEFLVALFSAAGLDESLPPCVNTGLDNDTEIPVWLKPYVAVAIERGIWTDRTFNASQIPTRAEAVVLTHRTAAIGKVDTSGLQCNDLAEIPDWAIGSYMALEAYQMLDLYGGSALPNQPLDRAYTADLVWQLYKYADSVGVEK